MRATLVEHLLAQQLQRRLELGVAWSPSPSASPPPARTRVGWRSARRGPRLRVGHDGRQVPGEIAGARRRAWRARTRPASPRSRSRLARCSAASSGASSGRPRTPRRSISRPRKTSGATVSSSAAALRCSSTKRWMRSRASGGTCGDSVAAASPRTRSSLRRRATWMTRASSTWRSSIGGLRQRAHDRGGVLRIDEQAHPREHVAHLRALEEPPLCARLPAAVASRPAARARSWSQAQPKDTRDAARRRATLLWWT